MHNVTASQWLCSKGALQQHFKHCHCWFFGKRDPRDPALFIYHFLYYQTLFLFFFLCRVKVCTKTDGSVNIHPKSVNVEETEFHYNWLVYHLKMRTSSVSQSWACGVHLFYYPLWNEAGSGFRGDMNSLGSGAFLSLAIPCTHHQIISFVGLGYCTTNNELMWFSSWGCFWGFGFSLGLAVTGVNSVSFLGFFISIES